MNSWREVERRTVFADDASMSVYFQMKNTAKREAIHFDGMQITLRELKKQIIALKKFSGEDAYENLHVSTKTGRGKFLKLLVYKLLFF